MNKRNLVEPKHYEVVLKLAKLNFEWVVGSYRCSLTLNDDNIPCYTRKLYSKPPLGFLIAEETFPIKNPKTHTMYLSNNTWFELADGFDDFLIDELLKGPKNSRKL
jgi:hypothetical protein